MANQLDAETLAVLRGFAVMSIASLQFAYRVCLADELGLLTLLLAGRLEEAAARASQILATLPIECPADLETQVREAWTLARHDARWSASQCDENRTDPAP